MAEFETALAPTDGPPFSGDTAATSARVISVPWHNFLLAAILLFSGWLNFAQLDRLGYANSYYAAAVRSMMQSWHNFFFNAFDPGGFVTIDKPPLGFWFQVLSAKIFGFNGVSLILPSALAGVLSVWLLYYLVDRRFGHAAGLLAALGLAVTPVAIASNRNNIIDSILVLFLLLGAWAVSLAAERGSLRWLLLCAIFVGLGFNIKMLEAYLVVPAFGLVYLVGAPRHWWVRLGHLAVAAVVLGAVSLSWSAAVDLTPASERPWVDSTTTNSELDLAIGYNGLQRLTGQNRGGGGGPFGNAGGRTSRQASGSTERTGALRDSTLRGIEGITAVQTPPSGTQAQGAGGALRFGGESVRGFSFGNAGNGGNRGGGGGGMFNNGEVGPFRLLSQQLGGQAGWLLPLAVLGFLAAAGARRPRFPLDAQHQALLLWGVWLLTAGGFFSVASFFHSYYLVTLAPAIAALAGIGVVMLWRDYVRHGWRGWLLPLVIVISAAVQASLLEPYGDWNGWLRPFVLVVCLASAIVLVIGRFRRVALLRRMVRLWTPVAAATAVLALLAAPTAWSAYTTTEGGGGGTPSAGPSAGGGFGGFGGGGGRGFGGFGGGEGGTSSLLTYLEQQQGTTKYMLVVQNSNSAATYIIQTGRAVMSLGGFSGSDPILTLSQFHALVKNNTVRFYMGGGGGFGGGGSSGIGQWVESACKAVDSSTYDTATQQSAVGGTSSGGSVPGGTSSGGNTSGGGAQGGNGAGGMQGAAPGANGFGNGAPPANGVPGGQGGPGGGFGGFQGGPGGGFGGFGGGQQIYDCAGAVS